MFQQGTVKMIDINVLPGVVTGEPVCVVAASPKGGVGKTMTVFSFGTELFRRGYTVVLGDCDPDGHLYRMWDKRSPELENIQMLNENSTLSDPETAIPLITESNFSKLVVDAKDKADDRTVIIIDMPGQGSALFKEAMYEVDAVLTPMTNSEADVSGIFAMKELVDQSSQKIARAIRDKNFYIPHVVFFTRTGSAIQPNSIKNQLRLVFSLGVKVLKEHLHERAAFPTMTFSGRPPFEQENQQGAEKNVTNLTNMFLSFIHGDESVLMKPENWYNSPDEVIQSFKYICDEIIGKRMTVPEMESHLVSVLENIDFKKREDEVA